MRYLYLARDDERKRSSRAGASSPRRGIWTKPSGSPRFIRPRARAGTLGGE